MGALLLFVNIRPHSVPLVRLSPVSVHYFCCQTTNSDFGDHFSMSTKMMMDSWKGARVKTVHLVLHDRRLHTCSGMTGRSGPFPDPSQFVSGMVGRSGLAPCNPIFVNKKFNWLKKVLKN